MAKLIMQEEGSAPSTPASGKWVAYFKASGLYIKDDAGNEYGPLDSSNVLLTTGGTSTAYTITTLPAAALVTGETFRVKFHATAGATPTLNRDGLGAKSLKYYDAAGTKQAVTSLQIIANMILQVLYDGTDYVILGGGSGGSGRIKIITFTRDGTAASGDVSYTGVGFTPKSLHALANINGTAYESNGVSDSAKACVSKYYYGNNLTQVGSTLISYTNQTTWAQSAIVKSYDADGFTLTWTKIGSPTAGTIQISVICFE